MPHERTLIILKPDAVQRGLIGPILTRFEARGLKLIALKLQQVSEALAQRHYAEHEGKPFYRGLIEYITSAPVVVGCLEGPKAIQIVRATVGATDPGAAAVGSIRADFALEIGRNLVHASDSADSAQRELGLWFSPEELLTYGRETDRWIFEQ